MITIPDANRGTQLLMHAISASVAMAASGEYIELDLSEIHETDHTSRKAAVAEHLRATMGELEALIRAQTTPPAQKSAAVLGTSVIENGEVYDVAGRTYSPGPGFDTLLKAAANEAIAAYQPADTAAQLLTQDGN